jgi:hypothetical protein
MVDCGYKVGCNGCSGGVMHKIYRYVSDDTNKKSIATLASYPYIEYESYCKDEPFF